MNINLGWDPSRLEALRTAVIRENADVGIAHDGGADRCLAVDSNGHIVDGDQIIAILALAMSEHNELNENTIVTTEMSNLGLQFAMSEAGIKVVTTPVGDRYISQELVRGNYSLGGEQSGHIIIPALSPVGDGIVTGLRLLERMAQAERPLADLAAVLQPIPQFSENVKVPDVTAISDSDEIWRALAEAKSNIGSEGRVVMRASGTENVVRIMAQARTTDTAMATARNLAAIVGQAARLRLR
jgi:phosphoglucosamine mutase